MKRTITIIIILLLVGGGVFYLLKSQKKKPIEWRTAQVEKGNIKVTVTATGTLNAVTTVQVGTQVSGTISKLYADFNSQVKAGQVIAQLDPTMLQAAVSDARAALEKCKVLVEQTKRDLDRTQTLAAKDFVAQADLDAAKSAYGQAVANEASANAQLKRAIANLDYATITAPISGVVTQRTVDVGQTVAASFNTPTLFTIANDLTKMQVEASIDEADIGQVQVGQPVSFTVDAYPGRLFNGDVKQIRLQPTITNNVVTYTVIVNVPNPDLKLMPGMTANITVNITEHDSIMKVPSAALRFTPPQEYFDQMKAQGKTPGGQDTLSAQKKQHKSGTGKGAQNQDFLPGSKGRVWVKNGDILKPVHVTIGLSDGTSTEVSGELKEGDEVVIGTASPASGAAGAKTQQQNPFAPSRGGGGGGRRM